MGLFAALVAFGAFALVPAISSAHGLLDTQNNATTTVNVPSRIVAYNDVRTKNRILITWSEHRMR